MCIYIYIYMYLLCNFDNACYYFSFNDGYSDIDSNFSFETSTLYYLLYVFDILCGMLIASVMLIALVICLTR